MFNRTFGIVFLAALGIHIVGMSLVSIIPPKDEGRMRPYTRVDFLGPILRKTAFDIMLDHTVSFSADMYDYSNQEVDENYLEATLERTESGIQEFPGHLEGKMDTRLESFLAGKKSVPGIETEGLEEAFPMFEESLVRRAPERKVIYKPEKPSITEDFYGDKDTFIVKVKVVIDPDGKVKASEPVTTSGIPNIDIAASKYVKSWLFEAQGSALEEDDIRIIEVELAGGE